MKFTKSYVDGVFRMCNGASDKDDTRQWLYKMLKIAVIRGDITRERYKEMYDYIMRYEEV